ncbi:hypothetical protein D1872_253860 [compost metagenome]
MPFNPLLKLLAAGELLEWTGRFFGFRRLFFRFRICKPFIGFGDNGLFFLGQQGFDYFTQLDPRIDFVIDNVFPLVQHLQQ